MKKHGPMLTLLAVALFMLAMFAVNMTKAKRVAASGDAYAAAPASTPSLSTPSLSTSSLSTSLTAAPTPTATPAQTATSASSAVPSGFPPQVTYTGWTAGHEASIAIAVKAHRGVAYLCDGAQVESWLRGNAEAGGLTLRGKAGDALTGRLTGHTVAGEISVGGRRLAFSAQLSSPPAGLYTATVAAVQARVTWIVRADGGQTGVQLRDGRVAPAPRLDPRTQLATVAGTAVQAVPVAGDFAPFG